MSNQNYQIYLTATEFSGIREANNWRNETGRKGLALNEPGKHAHIFEKYIKENEEISVKYKLIKLNLLEIFNLIKLLNI